MTHHLPPTEKETAAIAYLKSNVKGSLLEDDTHFSLTSDKLLLRFVRQKAGNAEKALALLEGCIAWRCETKPHRIQLDDVKDYAVLNVFRIHGATKLGVPIAYYIAPRSHHTGPEYRGTPQLRKLMRRGYTVISL